MQPEELESARRSGGDFHSRALFLFAAAFMILLGHLFDVLQVHGPNWLALAVRTGWAALLVANGLAAFRAPYPALNFSPFGEPHDHCLLFVALLAVTGRTSSPLFPYSYVLVILLPLLARISGLRTLQQYRALARHPCAPPHHYAGAGALLAWASQTSAFAIITGALLGQRTRWPSSLADTRPRLERPHSARPPRTKAWPRWDGSPRQVAHDINNPLSVARCNASFIQQAPNLDPEVPSAWRASSPPSIGFAGSVRLLQSGPNLPRRE